MNYICLISKCHYDYIDDYFGMESYITYKKYIRVECIKLEYLKDIHIISHIHNSYNYDDYNILIKIHMLNEIDSNNNINKNICTEIYNVINYIYNKCNTNILYNQIGYTIINTNDKNKGILTICYSDYIEDYYIKDTLIDTINGDITTSTFINGVYI